MNYTKEQNLLCSTTKINKKKEGNVMEKTIDTYIQMNTSTHLLNSYEQLALKIKQLTPNNRDYPEITNAPYEHLEKKTEFIGLNLTLLNLNAAILEGTLRTLICEVLHRDSVKIGDLSIEKKETPEYLALTRSYGVIQSYKDDAEFKGGWDNLKRQYKEYLSINLDGLLTKDQANGVNSIFTLRNIAAHGTALITTDERLTDEHKGTYPFKWQSKIQRLTLHVESEFGDNLMNSLSHPLFCKHFMDITKVLIEKLNRGNGIPENAAILLNNLQNYKFGFRNQLDWQVGSES